MKVISVQVRRVHVSVVAYSWGGAAIDVNSLVTLTLMDSIVKPSAHQLGS